MPITNNNELAKAISELQRRSVVEQDMLVSNIKHIKYLLDPIPKVNKLFPPQHTAPEKINHLIDESITAAMGLIVNKLAVDATGSFFKQAFNNFVRRGVCFAISSNAYKIKAVGIAVVKTLLPRQRKVSGQSA